MSAKKGKKSKGKSLPLGEFLGVSSTNGSSAVVVQTKSNWAEESEEFEDDRFSASERIVLPTAPRQARGSTVDPDRLPSGPPYIAYVANLPFEVEDEDIERFFKGLKVLTIRLPKEGGEFGRFKGFGYVEFESKNDLLEALSFNDEMMNGRKIRVDIAEEERSGGRREGGGPQRRVDEEREDRSGGVSDWRAAPRGESGQDKSPGRDRFDDRDRDRDGRGHEDKDRRYGDSGFGDRDRNRDRGYGDRDRDRGYGDRDRDRGYGDRDRDRGYGDRNRDRGYGDRDRYDNRGYRDKNSGQDRYDRGGRYDDRRGGDRGGGYDDRRGGDRYHGGGYDDRRGGDRGGGYRRDDDQWKSRGGGDRERDRDDESRDGAPKERPKLNLQPRSKPENESKESEPSSKPVGSSSSIFGAAKPVNTAKKEFEIEKKLTVDKEPKEMPKISTPSAKDIFGNARPVDTATREREIEEKLKKKIVTPPKDENDPPANAKRRPLNLEKRDSAPRPSGPNRDKGENGKNKYKEGEQDHNARNKDMTESSDRKENNHDEKKIVERNANQNKRPPKTKKIKDEDTILNTSNKFSQLGLDEEEV